MTTLHFFCGKMAAGKSTMAKNLAAEEGGILLSEDEWLGALYPGTIESLEDYVACASRLKSILGPHVRSLLDAGQTVILDFPANTPKQRSWFCRILEGSSCEHVLHYIEASDELCLQQLAQRSRGSEGQPFTTEAEFHAVNRFFQPPEKEEGFRIRRHARPSSPPETP